jgi:hypothetical protein
MVKREEQPKTRQLSIRLDRRVFAYVEALAAAEHRTIANVINYLLQQRMKHADKQRVSR